MKQSTTKWLFMWILLTPFAAYAFFALASNAIVQFYFVPKFDQYAVEIERYLPKLLQDAKLIEANPLFVQSTRTKNAAEFIPQYLVEYIPTEAQPNPRKLQLLKALFEDHKKWDQSDQDFQRLLHDSRLAEFSTDWMDYLDNFDHWDPTTLPQFQQQITEASKSAQFKRIGIIATLPWPEHHDILINLAKVHVLKRHIEGRAVDGFKTMRHLSSLIHSIGSVIDPMVAIALINVERKLADRIKPKEWKAAPRALSEAYKRFTWASQGLLYLAWFKGLPENIESYLRPEFGVCGAVSEMFISSPSAYYRLLVPSLPFEPDLSAYYKRSHQVQKKLLKPCGFNSLAPLMTQSDGPILEPHPPLDHVINFSFFLRGIYGLALLNVSQVDSMRLYRQVK